MIVAKLWLLTIAAHDKFQRRLLVIKWNDMAQLFGIYGSIIIIIIIMFTLMPESRQTYEDN